MLRYKNCKQRKHLQFISIFYEPRTVLLFAVFFSFDCFQQNSLSNIREFCRKLSNFADRFFCDWQKIATFHKNTRKKLIFVEWYAARAPPVLISPHAQNIKTGGRKMFDPKSDYALNKLDKEAIVCPSATGVHIRLTCEDFASAEEFARWKAWSDKNYQKTENAGQQDARCLSLDAQRDTPVPSAEEDVLAPYIAALEAEHRRQLLDRLRSRLTEKQYRRMYLYYLEEKTEAEIAVLEGITQQRISKSIIAGGKIIGKYFKNILCDRG